MVLHTEPAGGDVAQREEVRGPDVSTLQQITDQTSSFLLQPGTHKRPQ